MRFLVFIIFTVTTELIGIALTCSCDHTITKGNIVNTTVTCQGPLDINKAATVPNTTNTLILRKATSQDVDIFLQNLDPVIFINLLHLEFNSCTIPNLSNVSFVSFEKLQPLNFSENGVQRLPNPEIAFNLTSLKILNLSNNNIEVIENSPFRTLISLEVLNLSANMINNLVEINFAGLSQLRCLDISFNKLITLRNDTFLSLVGLQHLNLSSNLLEVLDESCMNSLQRLQQLDISRNRLTHVAPGSLQLPSLSCLMLSGNPALGRGSYEPTLLVGLGKRLQTVDVSETGLKQIPASLTHSIRTLILAGNSIRFVNCGHLDSYPLLQLLDLTSNDLEEIEDDALGRLELLSILHLSDNNLHLIPHNLPERLKVLHLEHNQIERISLEDFLGMQFLEILLLNDNSITAIGEGAFSQLEALTTLDISRNPISILPVGSLFGPRQLQVLRLANLNVISSAREMMFPLPAPEHLIILDLSHSPSLGKQFLADTATLAASKELQELDLSGNRLNNIRSDLLHFLPQLKMLKLTNNALNCSQLRWSTIGMNRQNLRPAATIVCFNSTGFSNSLLIPLPDQKPLNYKVSSTTSILNVPSYFDIEKFTIKKSKKWERNKTKNLEVPEEIRTLEGTPFKKPKTKAMNKDVLTNKSILEVTSDFDTNKESKSVPTINFTTSLMIKSNHKMYDIKTETDYHKNNLNESLEWFTVLQLQSNATTIKTFKYSNVKNWNIEYEKTSILLVVILGTSLMLSVMVCFRKWRRNLQLQDMEESSLSRITEIW